MPYVNPEPGGTVTRVDQGVDIGNVPGGTPVRAITNETLVGIIQNWYQGQPFYWFKQQGSNVYNYVAEQFRSNLRIGQSVQAGQQIGEVAPSGTGIEYGFATASGQTQARATTGYTEGQATPSGQSYLQQVIKGGSSGGGSDTLAQLWISNGGDPRLANTMAAIAMAESGGNPQATNSNTNGTEDRGLWQINSIWSQFNPQSLFDPNYNARAAVAVEKAQGLTAWSTYNSGAYKQFLGQASSATYDYGGPGGARTRPGGNAPGQDNAQGIQTELQNYVTLRDMPRTSPPGTKNPFSWWRASFTGNWSNL